MYIKVNNYKNLTVTNRIDTNFYTAENNADNLIFYFVNDISDFKVYLTLIGYEINEENNNIIEENPPLYDIRILPQIDNNHCIFPITAQYTDKPRHFRIYLTLIQGHNDMVIKSDDIFIDIKKKETVEEYITPESKNEWEWYYEQMEELIEQAKQVQGVKEYDTYLSFPPVGEGGVIYVDKENNNLYRWDSQNLKYYLVGDGRGIEQIDIIDGKF